MNRMLEVNYDNSKRRVHGALARYRRTKAEEAEELYWALLQCFGSTKSSQRDNDMVTRLKVKEFVMFVDPGKLEGQDKPVEEMEWDKFRLFILEVLEEHQEKFVKWFDEQFEFANMLATVA